MQIFLQKRHFRVQETFCRSCSCFFSSSSCATIRSHLQTPRTMRGSASVRGGPAAPPGGSSHPSRSALPTRTPSALRIVKIKSHKRPILESIFSLSFSFFCLLKHPCHYISIREPVAEGGQSASIVDDFSFSRHFSRYLCRSEIASMHSISTLCCVFMCCRTCH